MKQPALLPIVLKSAPNDAVFYCLRLQEEVLLSLTIAMAISWLLYSLRPSSANDYAFACFFLICTTSLLKIRWVHSDAVSPETTHLMAACDSLWGITSRSAPCLTSGVRSAPPPPPPKQRMIVSALLREPSRPIGV